MIRRILSAFCVFLISASLSNAQKHDKDFPGSIVIARNTYFDVGPPFDFYEVFTVDEVPGGLTVERAIISPAGDACTQPPSVRIQTAKLQSSMAALLRNKNPCDIPEKALHRESKRCKHCLNFSGSNVTMHVSCGGKDRPIRMDILEKDWFDKNPNTPEHTSWAISVLQDLDGVLGPGVLDQPVFPVPEASRNPSRNQPDSAMAKSLQSAQFDYLFNSKQSLSELYRESLQPPRSPMVELVSSTPMTPTSSELPNYPPIARAAHIAGDVTVTFDVTPQGKAENPVFKSGPQMLRSTVSSALAKWTFPATDGIHQEEAVFKFNLNCVEIVVSVSSSVTH